MANGNYYGPIGTIIWANGNYYRLAGTIMDMIHLFFSLDQASSK